MLRSIVISSIIVNLGLLLGRFSGFIREIIVASQFGVGQDSDVILFVLSIPDLLVNILVGGGLAAALIPEFGSEVSSRFKQQLLFQALAVFVACSAIFVFFIFIFDDFLISLLAPGFQFAAAESAKGIYKVVIWIIPLTVFSGILTAYLNAESHFISSSLGTLVLNISIISGLFLITVVGFDLVVLGVFVLLGGVVRILVQLAEAHTKSMLGGVTLATRPWLLERAIVNRYFQVAFSGSLILCFPLIFRAFSSHLGEGYYSIFNYAFKLVELPQVMLLGFITVVLFPRLSASFTSDKKVFLVIMVWGARLTMLLSSLALAFFYVFSDLVIRMVFGYGEMLTTDLDKITEVFDILIFCLPLIGFSLYSNMVFNSTKLTSIPLLINFITLTSMLIAFYLVTTSYQNYATLFVSTYLLSCILSLSLLFLVDKQALGQILNMKWLFLVGVCSIGYLFAMKLLSGFTISPFLTLAYGGLIFVLTLLLFSLTVPELRAKVIAFMSSEV